MRTRPIAAWTLLPVQTRDFAGLAQQWRVLAQVIGRLFLMAGLLPPGFRESEPDPASGQTVQYRRGLRSLVQAAARHYRQEVLDTFRAGQAEAAAPGRLYRLGAGLIGLQRAAPTLGRKGIVLGITLCGLGALGAALLSGFGYLLVGTAHAADTLGSTDLANTLLGDIFVVMGTGGGALATAFGTMLGIFSTTAFLLAGAGAILSCVTMLVEYLWHHESFAQRYNPWMFVLRVCIALSLLFPLGSGFDGAQYFHLVGVQWGSNKASQAWQLATSGFGDLKNLVAQPSAPSPADLVAATWLVDVCRAAVQDGPLMKADGSTVVTSTSGNTTRYDLTQPPSPGFFDPDIVVPTATVAPNGIGYCGSVTQPAAPSGSGATGSAIAALQTAENQKIEPQIGALAKQYVDNNVASICPAQSANCAPINPATTLATLIATYQSDINSGLAGLWNNGAGTAAQSLTSNGGTGGWVAAGSWARQLSDANASLIRLADTLPAVQTPTQANLSGEAEEAVNSATDMLGALGRLVAQNPSNGQSVMGAGGTGSVLDWVFSPVQTTINKVVTLDNLQPLAAVASVGNTLIGVTSGVVLVAAVASRPPEGGLKAKAEGWVSGLVVGIAKRLPPTAVFATLYSYVDSFRTYVAAAMPMIWSIGFTLILAGMMLAYVVPMLPAIRFLFAVVGWLIAVTESIILLPIMLVLMVSPEAGGFLVPMAKGCFWTLLAVTLRPIVTVLGFVAGLLLSNAVVWLINQTFLASFRDSQGGSMWGITGFLAFIVMYFVLVYVTLNSVFKLPDLAAHALYRWLGSNAGGERDDVASLSSAASGFAGRVAGGLQTPFKPKST
jgi:conjugal transfer/type IV secretion protein DotA/TraY